MNPTAAFRAHWLRFAAGLAVLGAAIAAWRWLPSLDGVDELMAMLEPYRHAWYALPAVVGVFVVLGIVLVPVTLLITVTGLAFGSWLGPVYAMAGCLASASTGFAIGRWLGMRRIETWGGEHIRRLARALRRNGTLAVFFIRKVPAPFTLVNVVIGASTVRYRDFLMGTTLGMGALVIALAGFGQQAIALVRDPSSGRVIGALLIVGIPLTVAWFINRAMRARECP